MAAQHNRVAGFIAPDFQGPAWGMGAAQVGGVGTGAGEGGHAAPPSSLASRRSAARCWRALRAAAAMLPRRVYQLAIDAALTASANSWCGWVALVAWVGAIRPCGLVMVLVPLGFKVATVCVL